MILTLAGGLSPAHGSDLPPSQGAQQESSEPETTQPETLPTGEEFLIIADEGVSAEEVKARAVALGVSVESLLQGPIEGVTADLTAQQRASLSVEPGVDYIERNAPVSISSSAVRSDAGCVANSMGNVDDASTGSLDLGFAVNWFGTEYDAIIVNNNGGISFDDGLGDFRSFSGINLDTTLRPLILPLFTDLDTRNSSAVTYGPITADGQSAYCVNWINVGEYPSKAASQSFQLVIINQGGGNIDLEFNYSRVSTPSSTSNPTFVIGYADPNNRTNSLVRVRSTDSTNPYVDGGSSSLIANKFPTSGPFAGRYTYEIRPTESIAPPTTPTPPNPGAANCTPTAQTPVTWGIDRIDQRSLPLNNTYACAGDGTGVMAYIVDTGIYAHNDFSARLIPGVSYVSGSSSTIDCNGHGTHVAGTVGGTQYGVAKNVGLVPVRVLDCSGRGYTSGVISGLNWIANRYNEPADALYGQPAVVNMSLGGGSSKSLDDAVAALVDLGITVVVAAGNDNADASNYSPAGEESAITVGATTNTDSRASYSNYGSVVDIFAPGSAIVSAWISSATSTATLNGTSMAAPHVAGAAAVYLGINTSATPAQVVTALVNSSTANVVGNPGSGSPNRLLYARTFSVAPTVDSLSPVSGSTGGGTTVTLMGANFNGTTGVTVGGSAATSVSVVSDSQLSFVTPAGVSGVASIAVTNGQGTTTFANSFTYTTGSCNVPVIDSLSTSMGAADGTTSVTINGSNLAGTTSVTFGGRPAVFSIASSVMLITTAPSNSPTNVNVQVTSNCGTSTGVTPFAYVGQPNISSLSVDGGPLAGGQTLTIFGSDFTTGSTVAFGSNVATSVTYIGSTQLRVVTPSGASGTVDVTVTTPGGVAIELSAYTYFAAPTISLISPTTGTTLGGTGIRIVGNHLEATQTVSVGGRTASFFIFSATEVYMFTPSGSAGTVDITLTSLGGSVTLANALTYIATPGGGSSGGGSSGGGSSGGGSSGGGGSAPDDITATENPVTTNQVSRPGEFQIRDASGAPVQLRRAELTSSGFSIAGADWELRGVGPLNSNNQQVVPGQRMTVSGEGLQRLTTTGIYVLSQPTWVGAGIVGYDNTFTSSFLVPQLPAGNHTLQINMVRKGQLPISIAIGFTLSGDTGAGSKIPTTSSTPDLSTSSANLIFFSRNSASLNSAGKAKLDAIAELARKSAGDVTVKSFELTGKNRVTKALATKRATTMLDYLKSRGVSKAQAAVTRGTTAIQSRASLVTFSPSVLGAQSASEKVDSLIVRYIPRVKPSAKTPITGSDKVTAVAKRELTIGKYLGLRMYQVDFRTPVDIAIARKVADQMTKSRFVEFAEPNGIVTTQVTVN